VLTLLLALTLATDVTAEFWGRTVPVKNDQGEMKAVASEHHLVVEITVKTDKAHPVKLSHQQFRLRVNGAKLAIPPDPAGMAASAIYFPDWAGRQGLEAQAGPVIIGRPRPTARFPGDPSAQGNPDAQDQGKTLADAMTAASLGEGELYSMRTGLLYFPWRGRVAKLKSLELVWAPADGEERVVKLR